MSRLTASNLIRFAPSAGDGDSDESGPVSRFELSLATRLDGVTQWSHTTGERLSAELTIEFAHVSLCERLRFLGPTVTGHPDFCLDGLTARYHWSECAYTGLDGSDWLIYTDAPADQDPILAIGWPAGNLWRAFDWSLVGPNYAFDPPLTPDDDSPLIGLYVPSLKVRLPMRLYAREVGQTLTHLVDERIDTDAPALSGGQGVLRADEHGEPVWSIRSSDLRAAIGSPAGGSIYELYWRIYKGEGDILYQITCDYEARSDDYRDRRGTPNPDGGFDSGGFGVFETCDYLAARVRFQRVPGPFVLSAPDGAISVGGDQGLLAAPDTEAGFDGSWSSTVAGRYFALSWSGGNFYLGGRLAWTAASFSRVSGAYAAAIRETTYLSLVGEDEDGAPLYESKSGVECVSIRLFLRSSGGHDVQVWRRVLCSGAEDQLIGIIADPPSNTLFVLAGASKWMFSPSADQVLSVSSGMTYSTQYQRIEDLSTTIHHANVPPSPTAGIAGPIAEPWEAAATRVAHQRYRRDRGPGEAFELYGEAKDVIESVYLNDHIDHENYTNEVGWRLVEYANQYRSCLIKEQTITSNLNIRINSTFNYLAGAYFEQDGSVTISQMQLKVDWQYIYSHYYRHGQVYGCDTLMPYDGTYDFSNDLIETTWDKSLSMSVKHSALKTAMPDGQDTLMLFDYHTYESETQAGDGLTRDKTTECKAVPPGRLYADLRTRPPRFVAVSEANSMDGCEVPDPLYTFNEDDTVWREANLRTAELLLFEEFYKRGLFYPELNRLLSANGDEFCQYVVDDERITEINGAFYAGQPAFQAALASPHLCLYAPEPYAGETWTPPSDNDLSALLVTAHNTYRGARGLSALDIDSALTQAATAHAAWMAENDTLSHSGADGSTFLSRALAAGFAGQSVGENIATGQFTIADVMLAWHNSPPHYANLNAAAWTHIGVAAVPCRSANTRCTPGSYWWAVSFGVIAAED